MISDMLSYFSCVFLVVRHFCGISVMAICLGQGQISRSHLNEIAVKGHQCFTNTFYILYERDKGKLFISSPEHNMLKVSYCDRSMSGIRSFPLYVRPSVNNYLKNL